MFTANTLYTPPKRFFEAEEWSGSTDWADEPPLTATTAAATSTATVKTATASGRPSQVRRKFVCFCDICLPLEKFGDRSGPGR